MMRLKGLECRYGLDGIDKRRHVFNDADDEENKEVYTRELEK